VLDFNDWRALAPIYEAASLAGIFIVLRPGPYINAETTAGGIAHWVTSQTAGELRTNASDFAATWPDYIGEIISQTKGAQVSAGGPVLGASLLDRDLVAISEGVPGNESHQHFAHVLENVVVFPTQRRSRHQHDS